MADPMTSLAPPQKGTPLSTPANLLADVPLPAAAIFEAPLAHNLAWMQRFADDHGAKLAPHGKTTMAPALFKRQIEAGAWGITLATAVQVDTAVVEHAQGRLREINGDAERQERRESFGLGSLELPDEFVCPITMEKMRGAAAALAARIARAPPPHLPRLPLCRPGGGVRRPHLRALRYPFGLPRRQRLEPAHPRAASAKRAHPEP